MRRLIFNRALARAVRTPQTALLAALTLFAPLVFVLFAGCGSQIPIVQGPIRYGTHETFGPQNLPQNYVSHADVTLGAGGSPTQLLAANVNRVDAPCYNSGSNSMRVGDSSIGSTQGTLVAAGTGVTLEVTGAIYGWSASGTTVNCGEEVRP